MSRRIPTAILRQIIMRIMAGVSNRSIAAELKVVGRTTVGIYRRKIQDMDLTNDQWKALTDEDLNKHFQEKVPQKGRYCPSIARQAIIDQLEYTQTELKRPGVTLQLLWREFIEGKAEDMQCSYQTFCRVVRPHLRKFNLSYHNPKAEPGSVLMIDFAGKKLSYTDRNTNRQVPCFFFVAVLGNSKYSFAEVIPRASTEYVIEALSNCLTFLGGVPASVLTDNMSQLVKKADRYEPAFTDAALNWANHYGIFLRATRIFSPKDKSDIERLVRLTYERIFATLRNYRFTSLPELRKAVREKLQEHNDRKFSGKSYSRSEAFEADERSCLKPLPSIPFELHRVTRAKAQKNYHVLLGEDRHYYSVPYELAGEQLDIRYTAKVVEIYYNHNLIATHLRSPKAYDYTTNEAHMPQSHRAYTQAIGFRKEDFIGKAAVIGPYTQLYVEHLLKSKTHEQQAYRSCLGLLSLGFSNKYGRARLEAACELACQLGKYTYKTVQDILKKEQDIAFITLRSAKENTGHHGSANHHNLRGREAFE